MRNINRLFKKNIKNKKADFHLKVIHDIGELINESSELSVILQKVVTKIAGALHFDVVSIYLWNEKSKKLVLMSTYGLKHDPEKPIQLNYGEGLTGEVYKNERTLSVRPASKHPSFKYFPQSGEKKYESYLGTPIIIQNKCLGVLTGQASQNYVITHAEETFFNIICSRLAGILELADKLKMLNKGDEKKGQVKAFQGKGVSGGIAFGKVYVINEYFDLYSFKENKNVCIEKEIERISYAFLKVINEIDEIIREIKSEGSFSDAEINIFQAHLMILKGKTFKKNIENRIETQSISSEKAVLDEVTALVSHFESLHDTYLRDRALDFKDMGSKLLSALSSNGNVLINDLKLDSGTIIVARHIGPSILNALRKYKIGGIVTEEGGETSHTSILARSLEIPAVTNIEELLKRVSPGQSVLIDGKTGFLFIEPDPELKKEYEKINLHQEKLRALLEKENKDKRKSKINVEIDANIGFPQDIEKVKQYNIENIGLFRTEFSYLKYSEFPDLQQQAGDFEKMADEYTGMITVRTLDIGADKTLPYLEMPKEQNPLLGMRSIRFSMENLKVFKEQITAILKVHKKTEKFRILLPLVSQIWEVKTAIEIIEECGEKLNIKKEHLPKIGVMIEVPALIFELKNYLKIIDFVSIGTNDLVQYLLAVDRDSNSVRHLYSHYHPAVIQALNYIQKTLSKTATEVSVCGEMAGTPKGALILLSLGYRKFSIIPSKMPVLSHLCKNITPGFLKKVKKIILSESDEKEIRQFLGDMLNEIDPLLLEIN